MAQTSEYNFARKAEGGPALMMKYPLGMPLVLLPGVLVGVGDSGLYSSAVLRRVALDEWLIISIPGMRYSSFPTACASLCPVMHCCRRTTVCHYASMHQPLSKYKQQSNIHLHVTVR
jgi:hypothetical protein